MPLPISSSQSAICILIWQGVTLPRRIQHLVNLGGGQQKYRSHDGFALSVKPSRLETLHLSARSARPTQSFVPSPQGIPLLLLLRLRLHLSSPNRSFNISRILLPPVPRSTHRPVIQLQCLPLVTSGTATILQQYSQLLLK
jgi:hypothetical protein